MVDRVDRFDLSKKFFEFLVSLSTELSTKKEGDFCYLFKQKIPSDVRAIKSFSNAIENYNGQDFDYVLFFKDSLRLNVELAEVLIYCFKCLVNLEVIDIKYVQKELEVKEED